MSKIEAKPTWNMSFHLVYLSDNANSFELTQEQTNTVNKFIEQQIKNCLDQVGKINEDYANNSFVVIPQEGVLYSTTYPLVNVKIKLAKPALLDEESFDALNELVGEQLDPVLSYCRYSDPSNDLVLDFKYRDFKPGAFDS